MRQKTVDAARGKWHGILMNFGIDEHYLRNAHGPCPVCGGDDRWRWDDKDGSGSYYCNHCGPGGGMKLLMDFTGWDFKKAASEVDKIVGNVQPAEVKTKTTDPAKRLRRIASELKPYGESVNPVRMYLRSRGLSGISCDSAAMKWHPALPYYDKGECLGKFNAMVCLVSSPTGEPLTYHLTYLTKDGEKADLRAARKIITPVQKISGGAIRLKRIEFNHLGIAEGIETALSVTKMYGIPCWSVMSSNGIETFQPPEGIRSLTIFADNDSSFTGQAAAYACAKRLTVKGYRVDVEMPDERDTDYNDELIERGCVDG